jgi:hypothetical protein
MNKKMQRIVVIVLAVILVLSTVVPAISVLVGG